VFLGVGDAGNGGGVDVQRRAADDEISRIPSERQTQSRSSTAIDVSIGHRLQHESC